MCNFDLCKIKSNIVLRRKHISYLSSGLFFVSRRVLFLGRTPGCICDRIADNNQPLGHILPHLVDITKETFA